MYRLSSMPYVLNVWIYECASEVNEEIVVKEGNYILKICNWRVVGVKPKFSIILELIYSQHRRKRQHLICLIIDMFLLLNPPHQLSILRKCNHKRDLDNSPGHLLLHHQRGERMYIHLKQRCPKRQKPNVPSNQPFSTPKLSSSQDGNVSGVPAFTDVSKLKWDNSDIEGLKQYLKDYAEEQIHVTEQEVTETHVPRNNLPSKILQSLYLTAFGSSKKGKEKMDDDIRLYHLSISIQSNGRDQWIAKELLKTHANKIVGFLRKQSRQIGQHWMLTMLMKIRKLVDCWSHNILLMLNLFKTLCNKKAKVCKYGALLWKYDRQRQNILVKKDNPPQPKGHLIPLPHDDLIYVK
ncbi:hypothetical protein H5410_036068 [Solanum commersonii]|uniref:Uncharacterized protein n=1 Tax=Solanum commersonii TaxID=4109 RepID=A0A9J5Y6H1_SOLCO|nr:hypothetical protein H5410_036068 [Solanum commersonii]